MEGGEISVLFGRMRRTMAIIHIKEDKFEEEVAASQIPVLVDFWAEWCGPCRMLSPIIEELEKEYRGKLKVCKINIDEQPTLAVIHRVVSIPTVCLYSGGKEVRRLIGLRDKPELDDAIQQVLVK